MHGLSPVISSIGISLNHPTSLERALVTQLKRVPWGTLLTLIQFKPNLLPAVEMAKGQITAFLFFQKSFFEATVHSFLTRQLF